MPNTIFIEFWGGWGYGNVAYALKRYIQESFPNAQVECKSAGRITRKIEVSWVAEGNKQVVWSKGRYEAANEQQEIVKALQ